MGEINIQQYWDKLVELVITYGGKLILAIVVWAIGLMVIKFITNMTSKALNKSKIELTLNKFIISLLGFALKLLLFVTCAMVVGIKMTAFVTIIGAMGLSFGLALQGSLSNFAGGVLINVLKPYKIGDFIETSGIMGTVKEISIFNTILNTPDNKRIIIPNSGISNNNITNFSAEDTRRVDLVFGVAYETDLKKAKEIILEEIKKHPAVLGTPEPFVRLGKMAASSLDITVRVWAKAADYWAVYFDLIENVKDAFDKEDIVIPFQQIDVTIKK